MSSAKDLSGNIFTLRNKVYDLFLLKCIIVRVIVFVGQ